jgi:hypothetical protein
MNNEKQSSVEWFAKESWKLRIQLEDKKITMGEYCVTYYDLLDKAKEMEKEQIEEAYKYARAHWSREDGNAERYYNETYGSNK